MDKASPATEKHVKRLLCEELLAAKGQRQRADFEFWIPRTYERADVVVIGAEIESFEIKTERDSLRRLPRQAEGYSRLFDRCTAVVAEKHARAVGELLPEWWGITTIHRNGGIPFTPVRPAAPNCDVDPEVLIRLLWRDEVASALMTLGVEVEAKASRHSLWHALLDIASLVQLRDLVRNALLERDPTRARIGTRRFTTSLLALEVDR